MNSEKRFNTVIGDFFCWLRDSVAEDSVLHRTAEQYLSEAARDLEDVAADAPFLSIVMRTQGKRPEMLGEVLLCLVGQSNTDFELLLMGHNLNEEQNATVTQILADQPESLRAKTRLIQVKGGTRTTPLNRGFEEARGRYIAVLDDDDLVFENWVEAFYKLAQEHNGRLLHSYAVKQDWQTVSKTLPNTPCAMSTPDTCYCADFKFFDQLSINSCPLCTLAFPAYVFKKWGIRFDESLTTTEDWDYMMRIAFLTGVADSDEITFLYRIWTNAENSYTLHNKEEWDRNYKKIVERYVDTPMIMPKGSLKGVIDTAIVQAGIKEMNCMRTLLEEGAIFYDTGAGMVNNHVLHPNRWENASTEICTVRFDAAKIEGGVKILRFDPCEMGLMTVKEFSMRVTEKNGTVTDYTWNDMQTNGYRMEDRIVYMLDDPQLWIAFEAPKEIEEITVHCFFEPEVSNEDRAALLYRKPTLMQRVVRKSKHILHKVIGR